MFTENQQITENENYEKTKRWIIHYIKWAINKLENEKIERNSHENKKRTQTLEK